SPLSEGKAGNICGGDRLPWVEPASTGGADNFAPLASRAWQVHLHGQAPNDLRNECESLGLALETFAWGGNGSAAGYFEDATYLVRPDGYVALADADAGADTLRAYARRHELRWR